MYNYLSRLKQSQGFGTGPALDSGMSNYMHKYFM